MAALPLSRILPGLALVALLLPRVALGSTTIDSVQYRPTFDTTVYPVPDNVPEGLPQEVHITNLHKEGIQPDTTSRIQSQFLHIGCFEAPKSITKDSEQDSNYDPNACAETCQSKMRSVPRSQLIVAVHGPICGCTTDFGLLNEVANTSCTFPCRDYLNPICGGGDEYQYWGVFVEYEYQVMSSQGAYDPWRYIWYTVVAISERFFTGELNPDDQLPSERLYLHAASTLTGAMMPQHQMRLPGILHGLQYDLDSSRLVGLLTSDAVGRTIVGAANTWEYYLLVISVNSTDPNYPQMYFIWEELEARNIPMAQTFSKSQLSWSTTSCIISKDKVEMFVFVQALMAAEGLRKTLHMIYFVDIPTAQIIYQHRLDFLVYQLMSNEKYGDVSAVGSRQGKMQYVMLARAFYNTEEDTKQVEWLYSEFYIPNLLPKFGAEAFEDVWISPGGSTSDHLYNKSYMFIRRFPNDYELPRDPKLYPLTLMEVNIRLETFEEDIDNYADWCAVEDCQGTVDYRTPYAAIFNREPRIPLSLAAPQLVSARFAMESGTILVEFNLPTLRGAIPIDVDGDVLPDRIDFEPQQTGEFDCARIFDADTASLFGDFDDGNVFCEWKGDKKVQITLDRDESTVRLGDQLFINPDTIYTQPRPQDNEFSMAATGGIQVGMPDPLYPPNIILTGAADTLDFCSPVNLDAGDSYNVGGRGPTWPTFIWKLLDYSDIQQRPDRIFNATKLALLRFTLENATDYSESRLVIPAEYMEAGTTFVLELIVISRWDLNTTRQHTLTKFDFPAPKVLILGEAETIVKETQRVALLAEGTPSECSDDRKLTYNWIETTNKIDFEQYPEINTQTRDLFIPPGVLQTSPDPDEDYNVYNFSVLCFAATSPDRVSSASVSVLVERSQVYVQLQKEDRLHSQRKILIIDARESQDPDDPTPPGSTFKGTFEWYCIDPLREPCWVDNEVFRRLDKQEKPRLANRADPAVSSADWRKPRSLVPPRQARRLTVDADGNLKGLIPNIEQCKTDPNLKLLDGGRTYTEPLFGRDVEADYCRWARGVLMVDTSNFTIGEHIFTIKITAYDGRTGQAQLRITISAMDIPSVLLEIIDPKTLYPTTGEIRIKGTLENDQGANADVKFSWRILKYDQNPDWVPERAEAAENNPDITYRVDKFTYLDSTGAPYDPENTTQFFAREDSPNLVIKSNTLSPSTQYKIRLITKVRDIVTNTEVEGIDEIKLDTAGLKPKGGTLTIEPVNATMDKKRVLSAPDWDATDLPLNYKFGYILLLGSNVMSIDFTTSAVPVSQLEVDEFPLGEETSNYSLTVYLEVSTPYGATTRMEVLCQSLPPTNVTAVVNSKFDNLENADPAQVAQELNTILSINNAPTVGPGELPTPEDVEIMEKVLDVLEESSANAPPTKETATTQAVVITKVIESGMKNDLAMDALEDFILRAADNNLFDVQEPELMNAAYHAIGSILPDYNEPMSDEEVERALAEQLANVGSGGFGQSVSMNRYRIGSSNTPMGDYLTGMLMSTLNGRQESNHKFNKRILRERVVHACPTAYCDLVFLACIVKSTVKQSLYFMCCDANNKRTMCEQPPCWFSGNKCPTDSNAIASNSRSRRLEPLYEEPADLPWEYSSAQPRALTESLYTMRNDSIPVGQRIMSLEEFEEPALKAVQAKLRSAYLKDLHDIRFHAREEELHQQKPLGEAIRDRKVANDERTRRAENRIEAERMVSQIITRTAILRDTIAKQAIVQLTASEPPLRFDSPGFVLYAGKTRNLSDVSSSFVFPDKYAVPLTAPDEPTDDNPTVSAFSFVYVEYSKNIYGWSASAPPGNDTRTITLLIMRASTSALDVSNESEPIRVFADMNIFSSGLCMYWDRFAPNTAGGAWSPVGLLNDGDGGCLTTHLSDIGLFIDGRVAGLMPMAPAVSYIMETTIDVGVTYSQMAILGFLILIGTICALWGYIRDELVREEQRLKGPKSTRLEGDGVTAAKSVDDPIAYDRVQNRSVFIAVTFRRVLCRDHALVSTLFYHDKFTRPQRILCLGVMVTCVFALNGAIYGLPDRGLVSTGQSVASGVLSGLLSFPVYVFMALLFSMRPFAAQKRIIKRRTDNNQAEAIAKVRNETELKSARPGAPTSMALPPPPPNGVAPVGVRNMMALPPAFDLNSTNAALPPIPSAKVGPMGATRSNLALPTLPGQEGLLALPVATSPGMQPMGTGNFSSMAKAGLSGLPGLPNLPPLPKLQALPGTIERPPPPPKHAPPPNQLRLQGPEVTATRGLFALPSGSTSKSGPVARNLGPEAERTALPMLPGLMADDPRHQALPASASSDLLAADSEATAPATRELRAGAQHTMQPALPKMMGPPPGAPPGPPPVPPMNLPGASMSQSGFVSPIQSERGPPLLPSGLKSHGSSQWGTPRTPQLQAPDTPGSLGFPPTPKLQPPFAPKVGGMSRGIVHRGEAFLGLPPPFLPKSSQAGLPPRMPAPPPFAPPGKGSSMAGFSAMGGGPAPPGIPNMPLPPPPPPPREDDATFVRRTRLEYMNRTARNQAEMLLHEEPDVDWTTPEWVYIVTVLMPYIACSVSICLHIFVNLAYSLKFGRLEEQNWYVASIIGIGLDLLVLEVMRSAVTTIVELRRFEIRRGLVSGEFTQSKIKAMTGVPQKSPLSKPKRPPMKPALPPQPPKVPLQNREAPPPPPLPPPIQQSAPKFGALPIAGPDPRRSTHTPSLGMASGTPTNLSPRSQHSQPATQAPLMAGTLNGSRTPSLGGTRSPGPGPPLPGHSRGNLSPGGDPLRSSQVVSTLSADFAKKMEASKRDLQQVPAPPTTPPESDRSGSRGPQPPSSGAPPGGTAMAIQRGKARRVDQKPA